MKSLRYIATVLLIFAVPLSVTAQMTDQAEVKEVMDKYDSGLGKTPSLSLFDLSRINLSHSYSVMFFSGGGYSGTQALYSGTLRYQLARPLTLTLNLGILHDPSSIWDNSQFGNSATFFPSGRLDWRPSDKFQMSIGFETIPAGYYGNYYYPGRYWYFR